MTKKVQVGWSLIPPSVLVNKDLSANEKLIFGRILGLTGVRGYCFASNYWLGKQIGIKPNTVSIIVSSLKNKGYIETQVIRDGAKRIVERRIFVRRFDNYQIPISPLSNTPISSLSKDSVREKSVEYSYNNRQRVKKEETEENPTSTLNSKALLKQRKERKAKKGKSFSFSGFSESKSAPQVDGSLKPLDRYQLWELAWKLKVSPIDVENKHIQVLESIEDNNRYKVTDVYRTTLSWLRRGIENGKVELLDDLGVDTLKQDHPDEVDKRNAYYKKLVKEGKL